MKKIKSIAHSVLNFNIPPLWLAVGSLVVFNVWQAYEILDMKRQVRSHAKSVMSPEPTVYVAKGGTAYHWRDTCSGLAFELRGQDTGATYYHIGLSEAKEKYGQCRFCDFSAGDSEAYWEETRRRLDREQHDFDEDIKRSLRRQGIIPPY